MSSIHNGTGILFTRCNVTCSNREKEKKGVKLAFWFLQVFPPPICIWYFFAQKAVPYFLHKVFQVLINFHNGSCEGHKRTSDLLNLLQRGANVKFLCCVSVLSFYYFVEFPCYVFCWHEFATLMCKLGLRVTLICFYLFIYFSAVIF